MSLILSGSDGVSDIDGSASTPAIRGTDANTGIFFPAADTIAFSEGGSEAMRIDSSGNVGIGTSSPGCKLDVYNSAAAAANNEILRLRYVTSTTAGHSGDLNFANGTGTVIGRISSVIQDGSNVALVFSNYGSGSLGERMRIAANGYVYINQTDTAAQDGHISIKATVAGQQCIDSWNSATTGTRFHAKFRDSAGATVRGSITSDGANTAYVTSSDYRLKENIAPLTGALSTIVQLKPSVWTWKENQEAGQGFIAHELAEVVPQAVTGEKDAVDADGKPQYQGVDTSFLVATLTAAIQELKAELDTTKARLAALEGV